MQTRDLWKAVHAIRQSQSGLAFVSLQSEISADLDQSHQNKFHAATLKDLTRRFATMHEGEAVSAADKDLWEYFTSLYKHSNKGIKGRGKDRRIFSTSSGHEAVKSESSSSSSSIGISSDESRKDDVSVTFNAGNLDYGESISRPDTSIWAG